MIRIKVPATTANVGPGFDSIGIALNMYNSIVVEKCTGKQSFFWPEGITPLPKEQNLIIKSLMHVLKMYSNESLGYSISLEKCSIPISRGLGSSAAAIVLGVYAANYLLDNALDVQDIINIATKLEGHPDNVVPAILGGMVISITENNRVVYSEVQFPDDIVFNLLTPNFKVSTQQARDALPQFYSRKDCVHNISRASMLVNSLVNRDYEKLRSCLADTLHQPYRLPLINNSKLIISKLRSLNTMGEFVSGAGPTIIALTKTNNKEFHTKIGNYIKTLKDKWDVKQVHLNTTGTVSELL